jgi:hypothetical protein
MTKSYFVFLLTCFSICCAEAQDTVIATLPSKIKEIRAIRIDSKLNVDGILNEPAWMLAPASPHFIQVEPEQGQPSHYDTKIMVLYNLENLYVGIIAEDPQGKKAIMATDFMRDFDFLRHDLVSLALDGGFNPIHSGSVYEDQAIFKINYLRQF